jgi:archaellum biogenesis ATPase FlaH
LWFSADRPVKKILNAFKENGFDIVDHKDRIIFVDMVSKLSSDSNDTRGFEVIYIDNPNNLVEVSITLQEVLADESIELAIIDSLNGILAFNDEKNVLKFVRFLSSIAEETDTAIISILYKGQYSNELETAFQIPCDGILSVEEEKIILKKKLETIII